MKKIKTYITSLSSDKAITDQLPLRIIKSILPIIISSITYIVNLSLRTGQFLDSCKQAVVTPIFKGGDNYDPNDYRPISILSIVSKSTKFLGVVIDDRLLWQEHVAYLENKLKSSLFVIKQIIK